MPKELLAKTTGAGNSADFYVSRDQVVSVMTSPNLAGSETADIQLSYDKGQTFVDYIDVSAVELTATKNAIRLYGPMLYRVAKDSTSTATGIYLHNLENL